MKAAQAWKRRGIFGHMEVTARLRCTESTPSRRPEGAWPTTPGCFGRFRIGNYFQED